MPDEVLQLVEKDELSAGHARSLIGLNTANVIARKIVQKKLSVRQTEQLTRQFRDKKFKLVQKKDPLILPPDFEDLPIPDQIQNQELEEEILVFKNMTKSEKTTSSPSSTEQLILNKIKTK